MVGRTFLRKYSEKKPSFGKGNHIMSQKEDSPDIQNNRLKNLKAGNTLVCIIRNLWLLGFNKVSEVAQKELRKVGGDPAGRFCV